MCVSSRIVPCKTKEINESLHTHIHTQTHTHRGVGNTYKEMKPKKAIQLFPVLVHSNLIRLFCENMLLSQDFLLISFISWIDEPHVSDNNKTVKMFVLNCVLGTWGDKSRLKLGDLFLSGVSICVIERGPVLLCTTHGHFECVLFYVLIMCVHHEDK